MPGISGIIFKKPKEKNLFRHSISKMSNLIRHRGPSQSGFLNYENIYLSHISSLNNDKDKSSREPMSLDDRYSIMLDGAIYNYREIRESLIKKKYKFYTNTHTEVALNAFKEFEINSFNYFNGDWVICILDKLKKKIIIAKDGLGTKPFYIYAQRDFISFCSEIKGFRVFGSMQFDYSKLGLNQLTIYNFNSTKFENIKQIEPGSYLEVSLTNLESQEKKWFSPFENLFNIHPSYEVNKNELKERVQNAVKLRLDSEKVVGTSLSGGLDSAIIFNILNELSSNSDLKTNLNLDPITVDYENMLTLDLAKKISKLYKRKLNIVKSSIDIKPERLSYLFSQLEISEEYQKQLDLYKYHKELGVDVSIDGQAIDHFIHNPTDLLQVSFTYFNNIVDLNNTNKELNNSSIISKVNQYFGQLAKNFHKAKLDINNLVNLNNFLKDYISIENLDLFEDKINYLKNNFEQNLENFNIDFQYTLFKTHFGSLQFFQHKWDKAAMASTIEMRRPYLDKNVCYYLLSLPLDKKIKGGKLKSILKDSFDKNLPDYIINQSFKQGLPISKAPFSKPKLLLMDDMINESHFMNYEWNTKKIKQDFKNNKNMEFIWEIIKFYLMQKGFDVRFNNLDDHHNFEEVPILNG